MPLNAKLKKIPPISQDAIALRITPAAEREIAGGSPWLYEASVTRQSKAGNPGDIAVIFDKKNRFLAVGLYDPTSYIRVRVLAFHTPQKIAPAWFQERLRQARQIRAALPPDTNGYRIIHGENDGFPGMVVDRYASVLVVKLYAAAWVPHLPAWCDILLQELEASTIVLRLSRKLQAQTESLYGLTDGEILTGDNFEPPLTFQEHGFEFIVDPVRGHKTGFYLDQRENRMKALEFTRNAQVLNVFAYSGGFSVYAAAGGAREVTSIDRNPYALRDAEKNFERNRHHYPEKTCAHHTMQADAFEAMEELIGRHQQYDVVILDPPSFASRQEQIPAALNAYRSLTKLGIGLLKNNGVVIQASCSSKVPKSDFRNIIIDSIRNSNYRFKEIFQTGHPLDHPVTYPPSEYLKCLFYSVIE